MCYPQRSFLMKRHLKLGLSCPGPWGPRPCGPAMGPRGHGIPSAMKQALMPRWRRPLKKLTHPNRQWCLRSTAVTMMLFVLSVRITTDHRSSDGIWPQSDVWCLCWPDLIISAGRVLILAYGRYDSCDVPGEWVSGLVIVCLHAKWWNVMSFHGKSCGRLMSRYA